MRKIVRVFVGCLFACLCGGPTHSQMKSNVIEVPFTFERSSVSFRGPNSGLDEAPFEGILGNDFFKDFVVTFDFRSTTVTFEEPERSGDAGLGPSDHESAPTA